MFIAASYQGLEENNLIAIEYQSDTVYKVVGHELLGGEHFYRAIGPFWETDLALKVFCKGYGPRKEDNYIRTLMDVCEDRAIQKSIFSHQERLLRPQWYEPLRNDEITPGLSGIERHYKIYLPADYQSFGRRVTTAIPEQRQLIPYQPDSIDDFTIKQYDRVKVRNFGRKWIEPYAVMRVNGSVLTVCHHYAPQFLSAPFDVTIDKVRPLDEPKKDREKFAEFYGDVGEKHLARSKKIIVKL